MARQWIHRVRKWCYRQAVTFLVRPAIRVRNPPIIAVTGTNGKSTTCKLLERIYRAAGYRVGCATSDGVLLDGRWIAKGDNAGANGLWRIICRCRPDLVVAETARGGVLRYGFGFARCDVAVATNIYEDHLGVDGVETLDEMARVKARLVRRARVAVLNADDARVASMAAEATGPAMYFTTRGRETDFTDGCFLRDSALWSKRGGREERLVDVKDVAVACGGLLDFQVENVLAVLAAVQAMQTCQPVDRGAVLSALAEFGRDPRDNLGRCTLMRYREAWVLLLECKNLEGLRRYRPVVRAVQRAHGHQRIIGLLEDVGSRRDEYYPREARLAGEMCDAVAVAGPAEKFLRGRTREQIIALLNAGLEPAKRIARGARKLDDIIVEENRPAGQVLFVVFNSLEDARIDLARMAREGEVRPLAGQ
jgi:cyanophycin synthetase